MFIRGWPMESVKDIFRLDRAAYSHALVIFPHLFTQSQDPISHVKPPLSVFFQRLNKR